MFALFQISVSAMDSENGNPCPPYSRGTATLPHPPATHF